MNILSIASVLPVPGLLAENDYVLKQAQYIQKIYGEANFTIFRPSPNFTFVKKGKWRNIKAQIEIF